MYPRSTFLTTILSFALVGLAGCDAPPEMTGPDLPPSPKLAPSPNLAPNSGRHFGVTGTAIGGGQFNAGVDVGFSFGVIQFNGFDATGLFLFSATLGGEKVAFHGRAICLTIDTENDRAWIGGVVTRNRSTHPSFTTPIHQMGRDIWFRVVDYGVGVHASQPDRSTFVGFEGAAGIITSEEYCEQRPWPGPPTDEVDARTNPLTRGNVRVRARE